MTSAAFSVPRNPQHLVSVSKRGGSASSATSQAADDAIRQLVDRRRLRNKHGGEREAKLSIVGTFTDAIGDAVNDQVRRFGLSMWLVRVGVAAAVFVILGSAVLLRGGPRPLLTRHSVDGVVLLNGQPLPHSIVEFHPMGRSCEDAFIGVAYTDECGRFTLNAADSLGLPDGNYAVVTKARKRITRLGETVFAPVPLPNRYSNPKLSPLTVHVTANVSGLTLAIRQ